MQSIKKVSLVNCSENEFSCLLRDLPELTMPTFSCNTTKHRVEHHIVTNGPSVRAQTRRIRLERLPIATDEFQTLVKLGIDMAWLVHPQDYGLVVKTEKCHFGFKKINFLGHLVSQLGIHNHQCTI